MEKITLLSAVAFATFISGCSITVHEGPANPGWYAAAVPPPPAVAHVPSPVPPAPYVPARAGQDPVARPAPPPARPVAVAPRPAAPTHVQPGPVATPAPQPQRPTPQRPAPQPTAPNRPGSVFGAGPIAKPAPAPGRAQPPPEVSRPAPRERTPDKQPGTYIEVYDDYPPKHQPQARRR